MESGKGNLTVVVVRHGEREISGPGWDIRATLTENGKRQARNFANSHHDLLEGCRLVFTSPLRRAQDTAFEMMLELGIPICDDNILFSEDLWTDDPIDYIASSPSESVSAWAKANSGFAYSEGKRIFSYGIVVDILGEMDRVGTNVTLCVSHGGPIDCLLAYVKSIRGDATAFDKIQDLGGCEGMVLTFSADGKLLDVQELRNQVAAKT